MASSVIFYSNNKYTEYDYNLEKDYEEIVRTN